MTSALTSHLVVTAEAKDAAKELQRLLSFQTGKTLNMAETLLMARDVIIAPFKTTGGPNITTATLNHFAGIGTLTYSVNVYLNSDGAGSQILPVSDKPFRLAHVYASDEVSVMVNGHEVFYGETGDLDVTADVGAEIRLIIPHGKDSAYVTITGYVDAVMEG